MPHILSGSRFAKGSAASPATRRYIGLAQRLFSIYRDAVLRRPEFAALPLDGDHLINVRVSWAHAVQSLSWLAMAARWADNRLSGLPCENKGGLIKRLPQAYVLTSRDPEKASRGEAGNPSGCSYRRPGCPG